MQLVPGRVLWSIILMYCCMPVTTAQDTVAMQVGPLDTAVIKHLVGIRAGYSITNVTSRNFLANTPEDREGFSLGVTYDRFLRPGLTLGAALLYDQRGFRDRVIFTDVNGVATGESYLSEFNYDYLAMPVRVGVFFGTRIHGFGSIGVVPALLLKAQTAVPLFDVNGEFLGNQMVDVTYFASSFDFAGMAEVGTGTYVHDRLLLSLLASVQHSLLSITNVGYFGQSRIRHRGVTLSAGVRYVLKR